MALYGISEEDVESVVKKGKREELAEPRRVTFTCRVATRFKHPIKVVGLEQGEDFLIITAYPLKKRRM